MRNRIKPHNCRNSTTNLPGRFVKKPDLFDTVKIYYLRFETFRYVEIHTIHKYNNIK